MLQLTDLKIGRQRLVQSLIVTVILVTGYALYVEALFRFADENALIYYLDKPAAYSRKSGALSVNIQGRLANGSTLKRYRINRGDWVSARGSSPRTGDSEFILEFLPAGLVQGVNQVDIELSSLLGSIRNSATHFVYDDTAVQLPLTNSWEEAMLEAQDGHWQLVSREGGRHVRPVPGTEGYDRIVLASGAFAGGRRVEVEVTFVSAVPVDTHLYGFGIVPFWAGHTDTSTRSPRRGWSFGISWFYSKYEGVGIEYSRRMGREQQGHRAEFKPLVVVPGSKHRISLECRQEVDEDGKHLRYNIHMTWQPLDASSETISMSLADTMPRPMEDIEYAVALIAHRAQVEFGSVTIQSLAPRVIK